MANRLEGKRVAFLAADGAEQVELTEPWKAVENEGGRPELISLEEGEIVEADVARGRRVTSWRSPQTDIRNAAGEWVDEEVVVDSGLVTSRKPDDLPAFCDKLVEENCEGRHEEQAQQTAGAAR
jgi:putative intracellular protease/amidase